MAERRTLADLERAVRSVSTHFNEDVVVVIGSQAALVGFPWVSDAMRDTKEIDIYLGRAKILERRNPEELEVSEEIFALFGRDSSFHKSFGFYVDGVSITTATMPTDWKERAVYREVKNGERTVTVIAPAMEDLVIAKLAAFCDKDKSYIEACHKAFPLDLDLIASRIEATERFPNEKGVGVRVS